MPLADVVVSEDDIAGVTETLRSGWLSLGPRTKALEDEFAAYTGARHALAVANGTAALHLAVLGVGLGPGDEVIVPSMTFVATANAVRYVGATPVFADIAGLLEPWLSAGAAEAAITPRTKAIMTIDYGGHAGELEELRALADERGLLLLEDAAHAAGSRLRGRHLGTAPPAAAFSFFSNKNLAVGEGGMVVTDDDDVAERMRLLRSHGMTTLSWDRHRGHASPTTSSASASTTGSTSRGPRSPAARLRRLDDENARRGTLVERYREALATCPASPPRSPRRRRSPRTTSSPPCSTRTRPRGVPRGGRRARRADQPALSAGPPVLDLRRWRPELPLTDAYAARTVTLPLFAHMTDAQLATVLDAVRVALSG